eukprot:jgi/Ulvmu1/12803/UM097_0032.1
MAPVFSIPESPSQGNPDQVIRKMLESQGYSIVSYMGSRSEAGGFELYEVTSTCSGARKQVRVYGATGSILHRSYLEMLRQSYIVHPHIVQPTALWQSERVLMFFLEHTPGSTPLRCAVPTGGLPYPNARFLFQQLVLTVHFCHISGLHLRNITPEDILIMWTSEGTPILKLCNFSHAKHARLEGPTVTPQPPSHHMAPHPQRIRELPPDVPGHNLLQTRLGVCEDYSRVCDVWSLAVTLYFLLYQCWPFSMSQIAQWANIPADQWHDDDHVRYGKEGVPDEVTGVMRRVFRAGRVNPRDYDGPTVADIMNGAWFQEGLPPGAHRMTASATRNTDARKQWLPYQELLRKVAAHEDPFGTSNVCADMFQGCLLGVDDA